MHNTKNKNGDLRVKGCIEDFLINDQKLPSQLASLGVDLQLKEDFHLLIAIMSCSFLF